jgi:capsular polysaccharide transport system permease protein
MNGIIRPAGADQFDAAALTHGGWRKLVYSYRWFIALVLLPTALIAAYYYLVASDQYESNATFVVRRAGAKAGGAGGVGQILGFSVGSTESQSEARIIENYLLSPDAVSRLRKEDALVERFRRDDVDLLSRIHYATPTPEDLLEYYRKHVTVELETEKGISTLSVKAFRPDDAQKIALKLLSMGEERVNALNERTTRDELKVTETELARAEQDMANLQRQITNFRRVNGDIDPSGSGKAQIGLVSELTVKLSTARAQLNSVAGLISRDSPQYRTLETQVRALEAQVAAQNERIAGAGRADSIANDLGIYEDLLVRQEFASKRYLAAAAAHEQAKAEARKQQLYLIRVVEPNLPVKSLYPERGRIVATLFFSLAIAYAIGWLMLAGVKEHNLNS